ncbi:metal ABC transporter substrate-binding protein [Geodermatophilus sp. CPCC 206100]|uniref:metal ABC transporter substrate-binding protein n=1 Tax=Geodermatophilus sp. CPCC 206100 TaxID=3020054 RepID=UPI003B008C0C
MTGRRARAAVLALATVALAGCTDAAARDAGGTTHVVTTSHPLQWVAEQVAGPRVVVTNLVGPRGDTHGFEPSPADVVALAEADLVVHVSGGLQPGVDAVLAQQPPDHLVDAAPVADLEGDPHFWLDPRRLAEVARDVGVELAELDDGAADDVDARVAEVQAALADLDEEYASALAGCRGATLVTAHEAYGYLAERHGLQQVGITGIDPAVEPSPARLREVAEVVRATGARTVFFDAAASQATAAALADDLGVATDVLDPVERVTADADYLELMRDNLSALQRGLVCEG